MKQSALKRRMTSMPKWANYYKKHHLNHTTHSLKVSNLLLGEDNICSPTYTEIIFWVSWCDSKKRGLCVCVCVHVIYACLYLQILIYACIMCIVHIECISYDNPSTRTSIQILQKHLNPNVHLWSIFGLD